MSQELMFYTNPMSRGRTVRWMLEEIGAPYSTALLDYASSIKSPGYLAVNPMGKVPALVHNGQIITETAAICTYLADAFPEAGLVPSRESRGPYFRWIFFASGPLESAFCDKAMGWEAPPERQSMLGYGTLELAANTLAKALEGRQYIAGNTFSAADVIVGSTISFMLQFQMLEARPAFTDYVGALKDRPAWVRARQIDDALLAEAQAEQRQS